MGLAESQATRPSQQWGRTKDCCYRAGNTSYMHCYRTCATGKDEGMNSTTERGRNKCHGALDHRAKNQVSAMVP